MLSMNLFMSQLLKNKKYIYFFLLSIVISLPAIMPYIHNGYFPTHDGEWAVVRLADMFRSLRDHQFPVRYSGYLNYSYGYPLFNFAYPLPYYLGVLIHSLRFGFVDTIKILFAGSVVVSCYFMILFSRELWKSNLAGVVSAIVYIYFPYRIVDLYVRGSLGESTAFALLPFVMYLIVQIANKRKSIAYMVLASFGFGGLIISHNIMAVYFSALIVIFMAAFTYFQQKEAWKKYLFVIITGMLMSSFFWLPALFEKQYILLSKIPIADRNINFVSLYQLLIPSWGYAPPDQPEGFTYYIGLAPFIIILLSVGILIYYYIKKKIKDNFYFKISMILVGCSLFFILSLFKFSAVIWKLPVLSEINYPWTLLGPIGFIASTLVGFLILENRYVKYLIIIVSLLGAFLIIPYAHPQYYVDRGDDFYITNDATTTSSSEYTPLWVKKRPYQRPENKIDVLKSNLTITNLISNSHEIRFSSSGKNNSTIRVNTIYYPGWIATVDKKVVPVNYLNDHGVMDIFIPSGNHNVQVTFSETPVRLLTDIISVLTILFIFLYMFVQLAKQKTTK